MYTVNMKKRFLKQYLRQIFLISIFFISFLIFSSAVTNASSDIEDLQKSIYERKNNIENLNRLIETQESKNSTVDLRLTIIQQDIIYTSKKLDIAQNDFKEHQLIFNRRLKNRYKFNNDDFLFVLLGSRDFFDFLSRASYTVKIIQHDNEILNDLINKREKIQYIQEKLQIQKEWELSLQRDLRKSYLEAKRKIGLEKVKLAEEEKRLNQLIAENKIEDALTPSSYQPDPNPVLTDIKAIEATVEPYNNSKIYTGENMPKKYTSTKVTYTGVVSWYGNEFHGRTTANGEIYNQYGFTGASRTLPFNTFLLITYKGRMVVLRINDRGPYVPGRILDLSKKGAEILGFSGIANVKIEIVKPVE